ncbi:hypothetical protein HNR00_004832 [Methylorubrum rhodinum]|uniref:Uncharacterized protein n=1 Tax=Methylorubrum rhodinum TaxID=29428 RepID=A0A840ZPP7_9HYPH|nr:hypothetical protein [Methylorubrum rhodinum]MBB5760089.1 hypothetical protein [Methylorubrum rhodinum]
MSIKRGGTDVVVAILSWALAAGQEVETIQFATTTGTKALNPTGKEFGQTLRESADNNVPDGRGGADTYGVDSARDVAVEARALGPTPSSRASRARSMRVRCGP